MRLAMLAVMLSCATTPQAKDGIYCEAPMAFSVRETSGHFDIIIHDMGKVSVMVQHE